MVFDHAQLFLKTQAKLGIPTTLPRRVVTVSANGVVLAVSASGGREVAADGAAAMAVLSTVADLHILVAVKDKEEKAALAQQLEAAGVTSSGPPVAGAASEGGGRGGEAASRPSQLPPHKILYHSTEVSEFASCGRAALTLAREPLRWRVAPALAWHTRGGPLA